VYLLDGRINGPARKRNGTPIGEPKFLEVTTDPNTEEGSSEVIKRVGKPARKKRMTIRSSAITLKAQIVDDLIGIEGEAQRTWVGYGIVPGVMKISRCRIAYRAFPE
jgi:hypothetical protein